MDRLISYFLALAVSAGLMFAWDRHGDIGFHMPFLFWHIGFTLPDSLATQRDKAVAASGAARTAQLACTGQLTSQNADIARMASAGATAMARVQAQLDMNKDAVAGLRASAGKLAVYVPVGIDACAKWNDADRAVLGALK